MKSDVIIILIVCFLGFFILDYFQEPDVKVVTEYKQGKTDTLIIRDTLRFTNTVTNIEYKTDTIRDTIEIISSFVDSTDSYLLNVRAWSLTPVRSFEYDLSFRRDTVKILRTDTIREMTTEIEKDWYYVGGALILGYLIGK